MKVQETWEQSELERIESLTGMPSLALDPAWGLAAQESDYAETVSLALVDQGKVTTVALGLRRRKAGFSKIVCGTSGGVGVLGQDQQSMATLVEEMHRRWRPSVYEVFGPQGLTSSGLEWSSAYTLHLDLRGSSEDIRMNLEKRTRNALSRGERAGIRLTTASAGEVDSAYDLLEATASRKRFPLPSRGFSLSLHNQFRRAGLSEIVLARRDSDLLAMVHVLGARGVASWWKGGATDLGYRLNGTVCAQWRAIELARERGFLTYDFGGTHPSEPRYAAIHRYKSGFGGRLVTLALGRRETVLVRAARRIRRPRRVQP